MNNNNPFPGRKIQVFELPNGNRRIIWKHPNHSLLVRITTGVFFIPMFLFWSIAVKRILEQLRILFFVWVSFPPTNILDYFKIGIAAQGRVFAIAFLLLCFLFMIAWIIGVVLSTSISIGGTGYSSLDLNNEELLYHEGKDPLELNSKEKLLFEENYQKSENNDIDTQISNLLKIIYNWKQIILGKPTITFSKQEIQDIQLECVETRLKLFIILNNQKIAIGKYLYNSEKEWLHKIVTQWLNGDKNPCRRAS